MRTSKWEVQVHLVIKDFSRQVNAMKFTSYRTFSMNCLGLGYPNIHKNYKHP